MLIWFLYLWLGIINIRPDENHTVNFLIKEKTFFLDDVTVAKCSSWAIGSDYSSRWKMKGDSCGGLSLVDTWPPWAHSSHQTSVILERKFQGMLGYDYFYNICCMIGLRSKLLLRDPVSLAMKLGKDSILIYK